LVRHYAYQPWRNQTEALRDDAPDGVGWALLSVGALRIAITRASIHFEPMLARPLRGLMVMTGFDPWQTLAWRGIASKGDGYVDIHSRMGTSS
jgi:hypothetical protein